jgi:hypothetical protein
MLPAPIKIFRQDQRTLVESGKNKKNRAYTLQLVLKEVK